MEEDDRIGRAAAQTFIQAADLETADENLAMAAMELESNGTYDSPWPGAVARVFSLNEPLGQDMRVAVNTTTLETKVLDRTGSSWIPRS